MKAACADGPDSDVIHNYFIIASSSAHTYGPQNAIWIAGKGEKGARLVQSRARSICESS